MAGLKFGDAAGGAQKTKLDRVEVKSGENKVRMFGNLLARYVYWIPGENGKNIPFECLEFNRDTEKFGGTGEKDWVKEYYPDIKCQWAYAIGAVQDGQAKVWDLKKKLTDSILKLARDPELGDPTDPETGWDVVFSKEKTGPLPINVGYALMERKLKQRALTDEEREIIANAKPIEELIPRPTSEQQKELLEKLRNASSEQADEEVGEEFKVQ
jgi:hypothetical protein